MGAGRIAQVGAVLVGAVYIFAGVIGFIVTGFGSFVQNTGDTLLTFDINPFHNTFHIVVGAYLVLAVMLGRTATEGALIGGGLVYLVAAFLGFTNHLQIISINNSGATDQFLHVASGLTALLLGLYSASRSDVEGSYEPIQRT
ncbi:MAG: DUF4383 domain-containing protein [Solirubrobacteraceae bacterium]